MSRGAYYNEIDPYAAAWLRNLIEAGHIAPGVVDERSIEDVQPDDLRGFTQCHFFAGIGVWSHALRQAGWDDSRPVWTGSCPCQPFSDAGKGAGFADERHLWPAFFHLIGHHRPAVVFGEQVASSDAGPWLDLVQDDLEAVGYSFGAIPFPSAGVGAPQPRERLYWLADSNRDGRQQGGLPTARRVETHRERASVVACDAGAPGALADTAICGWGEERADVGGQLAEDCSQGLASRLIASRGACNGFWGSPDWILCCDPDGARWRPVEPGSFPLAHGVANRVGRLRAYGNAINAEAARCFIEAYLG